ncbi:hypothetical protein Celaphus_00009682 [Cervus elaphus hippelaphus]|uniref:HSF-type DNA-binding domain-containing protein n=1 Tax=Cervus elaphus hippelaphus TaxID=46360 RepID=A0A212C0P8_CEREH|nr:hypothetical protein Celaphus_00009682 [Cervus elaphus hippelaphus]
MASQSSHEAQAAPLAPSTDGEPTAGHHPDVSQDPNMDSGEALEKNPPPQGLNPETANDEENNDVLGLSFPRKLWMIMEDAAFTSVCWNDEGNMVVIKADLFQTEVLQHRGTDRIFKTESIKTCIRKLNLYGFSKIHPLGRSLGKKRMMNIWRKGDPRTTAQPITGATMTPKRKKHAVATRCSPQFHHNESTQEADKKAQKRTPTVHGIPGWCSFVFCGLWFMGSVAMEARASHLPSEQGSPSGEGSSSYVTSVPLATAGRDSYVSLMIMYNTYFSIVMAAVSVVAPNKASEAEEEKESSDYKCALCEQFKDNPNP